MAKKQPQEVRKEIVQLMASKKSIMGTERTLKGLKLGKVSKVYVAENTPMDVRKTLVHYCALKSVPIEELPMSSEDVGVLCKKPFSISVLSSKNE